MKDFTNVRYLKFSAQDPWEAEFYDVVIDLVTDCMIKGIVKIGEEGEDKMTINIEKDLKTLDKPEFPIFAKVVDTGSYYLLDENMNVLFESYGYVPHLMDYYNREEGCGDCIELLIDDISTGHLAHSSSHKITFNRAIDWTEVEQKDNEPNLYAKGMGDAFGIIKKICISAQTSESAVSNIIALISKFENNNVEIA